MGCGAEPDFEVNDSVEVEQLDMDAPEGVELKTDRVGERYSFLDQIKVGETIRFTYEGGSSNEARTVLVTSYDAINDTITGITLERDGQYRTYRDADAYDIIIVKPFVRPLVVDDFAEVVAEPAKAVAEQPSDEVRVRFDEAGEKLLASLSGEQLAELYNKHVAVQGIGTTFDSATGDVVVKLPKKESKIVSISTDSTAILTLAGKNGTVVKIFMYDEDGFGYVVQGKNVDKVVYKGDENPLEGLIAALQLAAE